MAHRVKTYELWHAASNNSYAFFERGAPHRGQLEPDAELVWTVEAASWDEACTKRNEHLGYEPYKPMAD